MGVRFGVSLAQGKRCYMEDTAACLTDAFSVDFRGEEINNSNGSSGSDRVELSPVERAVQPKATASAAGAGAPAGTITLGADAAATSAISATTTPPTTATAETEEAPEAAAYFGLFDGMNHTQRARFSEETIYSLEEKSPVLTNE